MDDLDAEHARFAQARLSPSDLVEFAPGGTPLARFFVADPDGYQIEVLQ